MDLIDKILTEWAYRVHDGMPNYKNPQHIIKLKESMEELKLSKEFIFEFIQNLFEQKFAARSKKSGKIVFFKDKDRWKDSLKSGSHEEVSDEEAKEAEKELAKQGEEPDSTGEEPTEEPPEQQTTPKVDGGESNPYDKETDEKEKTFKQKKVEYKGHKISLRKELSEDRINKFYKKYYPYIHNDRKNKDIDFTSEKDLLKLINVLHSKLFGKELIIGKQNRVKGTKLYTTEYYFNQEYLQEQITIYQIGKGQKETEDYSNSGYMIIEE